MDLNNLQVGDATIVGGTKITAKKKKKKKKKRKEIKLIEPAILLGNIKKLLAELETLTLANTNYSSVKTLKEMLALDKKEEQRFSEIRALVSELGENKYQLEKSNDHF